MKSKINWAALLIALGILSSNNSIAQENTKQKKIQLSSVSMSKGLLNFYPTLFFDTHDEFLGLTLEKDYLRTLDDLYNWNGYPYGTGNGVFGSGGRIQLGFQVYNKKADGFKPNRQFNVGISNNRINISENGNYTFTIGDTVTYNTVQYRNNSHYIGIDINQIFSSNNEKLIQCFVGYGIDANFSLYNSVTRYAWSSRSLKVLVGNQTHEVPINNSNGYQPSNRQFFEAAPANYVLLYVPFGVAVKLSKKREVLKDIAVTLDGRSGIGLFNLGDGKQRVSTSFGLNFGVKYNLLKS